MFVKNKILTDRNGSVFKVVESEVFLTSDKNTSIFDYQLYVDGVRSNIGFDVVKLYLLNEDETPYEDVSEYVLSGDVSYNYQQGQTHCLNITVVNSDGYWEDTPINGSIKNGRKFLLDVGIYVNGTVYWRRCGVFVLKSAHFNGIPTQTVSLQLLDKFSLFDGSIGGNIDSEFKIPVGTNLVTAINMCVNYDFGDGFPIDKKSVIYESDLSSIVTPYTITHSANTNIGSVLVELADMVSHDIFYNENGNLTIRPGVDKVSYDNRPVQWYYTGSNSLDYAESNHSIDYSSVINKITVRGSILNGRQFKGVAVNDNPYSKSNINLNRINSQSIEDKNITSDDLAKERAEYELGKLLAKYTKDKFKSIFVPHLQPRDIVMWTCPEFNIYNEKYVLQSISFRFGDGFFMGIEMSNIQEVELHG